ncbi:MAG: UvrD-helicase domain-containing protein, partial [bacterium]
MLSDPIFTTLDADQRRAVLHDGGPLLLVAGAGSGKTRAIVARIVRLLRDGVPARSILGITFTNRAAGEMRERVAKALVPGGEPSAGDAAGRSFPGGSRAAQVPWLGTFHSFGALLLRRHGDRIGLSPRFVIYDTRDQHDVLKRILKELNVDEKKFPPAKFGWLIERAKRDGVSVEQAALSAGWRVVTTAGQVGKAYDDALAEAGAVDFTDLIRLPVTLLRGAPDVLAAVRSEYRHLLVDEFQDVDGAQAELTELLAQGADSFCAVGDEDQSIYGWRGASAAPMLSFEGRHPGAKVIHLSTNYRSRAAILSVAGALIAKNRSRREKKITPAREGGERPAMSVYADQEAEAQEVAAAVAREIRAGVPPTEIAVFYRVNAQSRAVEDALRMVRIPYVLRGALSFYERAAVRDAVSYLKWFLHPDDAVSLKRLLKFPRRGVGEVTLEKARAAARREGIPPSGALSRIPNLAPLFSFRDLWLAELPQMSPAEALHALLKGAGYLDALEASAREPGEGREGAGREEDLEHVRELLRVAEAFTGAGEEGLLEFLEKVTLAAEEAGGEESEAVRLMTLHNAKGLEFDVVFLVGLEDGLLPHSRSVDSPHEIEEERRLFYVGLT